MLVFRMRIMSASTIIDTAPLGARLFTTDGGPKPPRALHKKLAAWERSTASAAL